MKREVMFGPYLMHPESRFIRLFGAENRPSRIYFTEWDPDHDTA